MSKINNISNNEYVLLINKYQKLNLIDIDDILKKIFKDFFLGDYSSKTFNNELKTFIYLNGYDLIYSEDKKFIDSIDFVLNKNKISTSILKINELNKIQNEKISKFEKFLNPEIFNNENNFDIKKYFSILDLTIDILLIRLKGEYHYGDILFNEDLEGDIVEFSKLFNFNKTLLDKAQAHIINNIDAKSHDEVNDNFLNFEFDFTSLIKSIENNVTNFYEIFICFENYFWIGQTLINLYLLENENQENFIIVNDLIEKYNIVNKITEYNNLVLSLLSERKYDEETIDFIKDMEIENFDKDLLNSISSGIKNNFDEWNKFKNKKE